MPQKPGDDRPKATIEATATEVTSGLGAATGAATSAAKGPTAKTPPKDASKAPKTASGEAKATTPSAKDTPPPQPSKRSGLGYVLAGLVGGIVVAAALGGALLVSAGARDWLSDITGARTAGNAAEAAATRIEAVAAEFQGLANRQAAALEALDGRLAAAEATLTDVAALRTAFDGARSDIARLGELPAQVSALGVRAGAAETRLDTIARDARSRGETVESLARALDQAANAGTSAAAVSSGLARQSERLDDLERALGAAKADIEARVSATIGAIPAADPGAAWRDDADARLAGLRADLDGLQAVIAADTDRVRAAALEDGLARLQAAAGEGAAFADILGPLGEAADASALTTLADTGAPSIATLLGRLESLPTPAPASGEDTSEEETGAVGRIARLFGNAVRVRRVGDDDGDPSSHQAVEALRRGDAAAAADIIAAANQGPEADAWVADARARARLDAALTEFTANITRQIRRLRG